MKLPLEIDMPVSQQPMQNFDALREALETISVRVTKRVVFVLMIARTYAEDQATAADLVNSIRHFCEQRWIPETHPEDESAEFGARCGRRKGRQQGPPYPHPPRRFLVVLRIEEGSANPE